MTNFNFYKSAEVYREKYYQMPKVFFTNPNYMNLSNDAKIAYMLLKDRFNYSVKSNWVDEDDNIYFNFTVEELMQLLNCREGKVAKIKKELESANLLFQKKGRIQQKDGKIKSAPNKLYLGKPKVTAQDVFAIKEEELASNDLSVNAKIANTVKTPDNNNLTVNAKIANTAKPTNTKGSTVNAKIADNLFYSSNSLDTNRHNIDTEKDHLQDQLLLDNFETIMKDNSIATFVPERVLSLIRTFSSSYSEAQKTVQTIHNAKAKAEKDAQTKIIFEDLDIYGLNAEQELYQTLLKAYQKQKTEKVENIQNLIFVYVKNWFMENPIAAKQQAESSEELPKVPLHDWLNEG